MKRQLFLVLLLLGVFVWTITGVFRPVRTRRRLAHLWGDQRRTRYSPLDQINANNFNHLEVAWRFKTDHLGPRPEFNLQSTPLVVNGVLYSTGGTRRGVVALDAETGELLWMHSEDEGKRAEVSSRKLSGRGLVLLDRWERGADPLCDHRLPAGGARREERDAGATLRQNGAVDLKQDNDQMMDLVEGDMSFTPPLWWSTT